MLKNRGVTSIEDSRAATFFCRNGTRRPRWFQASAIWETGPIKSSPQELPLQRISIRRLSLSQLRMLIWDHTFIERLMNFCRWLLHWGGLPSQQSGHGWLRYSRQLTLTESAMTGWGCPSCMVITMSESDHLARQLPVESRDHLVSLANTWFFGMYVIVGSCTLLFLSWWLSIHFTN